MRVSETSWSFNRITSSPALSRDCNSSTTFGESPSTHHEKVFCQTWWIIVWWSVGSIWQIGSIATKPMTVLTLPYKSKLVQRHVCWKVKRLWRHGAIVPITTIKSALRSPLYMFLHLSSSHFFPLKTCGPGSFSCQPQLSVRKTLHRIATPPEESSLALIRAPHFWETSLSDVPSSSSSCFLYIAGF